MFAMHSQNKATLAENRKKLMDRKAVTNKERFLWKLLNCMFSPQKYVLVNKQSIMEPVKISFEVFLWIIVEARFGNWLAPGMPKFYYFHEVG